MPLDLGVCAAGLRLELELKVIDVTSFNVLVFYCCGRIVNLTVNWCLLSVFFLIIIPFNKLLDLALESKMQKFLTMLEMEASGSHISLFFWNS